MGSLKNLVICCLANKAKKLARMYFIQKGNDLSFSLISVANVTKEDVDCRVAIDMLVAILVLNRVLEKLKLCLGTILNNP